MKRLFAAILCLCLLAGCGRTDSTGNTCRAEDEPTVGAEKAEPIGESFRIIQEKPDWLLLAKEEGGSAEVYTPVSYTHLDVYKRQAHRYNNRAALNGL